MSAHALSKGRPVVLLDCDGPLADFTTGYLGALADETGHIHSFGEVDRWAIHECSFFIEAARQCGLEPSELRRRVDSHVLRPGFCSSLRVQEGVQYVVEQLTQVADVYVVTSPWDSSTTWMHERLHWVAKHFPSIGRRRVIQTAQKHLIRGDVFVDDKPEHVREWQAAWPSSVGVLFDMHHNRTESPAGVARAGWPFVIAATEGRANG